MHVVPKGNYAGPSCRWSSVPSFEPGCVSNPTLPKNIDDHRYAARSLRRCRGRARVRLRYRRATPCSSSGRHRTGGRSLSDLVLIRTSPSPPSSGPRKMRDPLIELGLVRFYKTTGGKGTACGPAACGGEGQTRLAGGERFCRSCLPADGAREPAALSDQDGQEPAQRPYLLRLPSQRSHGDCCGAIVAPRPSWPPYRCRCPEPNETDLDPKRFTIRIVPALLVKTNAWQDYCDGQRSLEQAIKRLAKSMSTPPERAIRQIP